MEPTPGSGPPGLFLQTNGKLLEPVVSSIAGFEVHDSAQGGNLFPANVFGRQRRGRAVAEHDGVPCARCHNTCWLGEWFCTSPKLRAKPASHQESGWSLMSSLTASWRWLWQWMFGPGPTVSCSSRCKGSQQGRSSKRLFHVHEVASNCKQVAPNSLEIGYVRNAFLLFAPL